VDLDTVALLALALAAVGLAGSAGARRVGLPEPVALCLIGIAAGFLPGLPDVELPPELVFLVFLPPLLYRSSFLTSAATLRRHAAPIALLSVGLVLATALAVAVVVDLVVPGMGLAEGLVLGAIVAPTDPVAAAGVFARLGAPRRVVDLVEGESLVNDATALVLFALAVEAVLSGPPTLVDGGLRLLLSVAGGVVVGLVVGAVVSEARRRLDDVGLQLGLSLLTPFLAYLPADRIGASGVLAVVTTGVLLGARAEGRFSPAVRLQSAALWSLVDLLLNAVLFVLLGLQVRRILETAPEVGTTALAVATLAVVATVLGLRLAWQFVVPPALYQVRSLAGRPQDRSSPGERLLIGWVGMRGAVSLAAALAVPLEVTGRPVMLLVTVAVILATLVLQGTTLGALLRRVHSHDARTEAAQEQAARRALAEVALAHLDDLEASGRVPAGGVDPLRRVWQQARARTAGELPDGEVDLVALRLDVARVQGEEVERRRRAGELLPELARTLRAELDLQEVRLQQDRPTA
jgi:Na+/H+ antiporter